MKEVYLVILEADIWMYLFYLFLIMEIESKTSSMLISFASSDPHAQVFLRQVLMKLRKMTLNFHSPTLAS